MSERMPCLRLVIQYLRGCSTGTNIHAIELHTLIRGLLLARSAGTYAELTNKEDRYAVVKNAIR